MYVRTVVDESGNIFLEQLLSFADVGPDGRLTEPKPTWERVPTLKVGGGVESYSSPIGKACGVMLFDSAVSRFDADHGRTDLDEVVVVSAFDVYKVTTLDITSCEIFTSKRDRFKVKVPSYRCMEMVLKLMNQYTVLRIDKEGNLKGESP